MKSISKTAEDFNRNLPASDNNITAFSESALTPESTSDRSQDKSGKTHSFSNSLAKEIQKKKGAGADHGAHEALVVKYLGNRVAASTNDIDGKKWFYIKIKDLQKQYPYLSTSALLSIVHTLDEIGYCEIANHNKYKYDRTFWYHVPTCIRNKTEEELRYFNTMVAAELGVPTAVLIDNLEYWLGQCEERGVEGRVRMSPRILVDLLPFSERTIKRGLKTMEEKNYAVKLSETKPLFGKPIIKSGPNQISVVPNQIQVVPNQISVGPNQCDDTYYKTINNLLETCSKEKPAASFLKHPSGAEKANDEPDYSSQVRIAHDADEQDRDVIGHDEITSPCSENHVTPSTQDISGGASDVKNEWPHVSSLDQLHSLNRGNSDLDKVIEKTPGCRSSLRATVLNICAEVMSSIDENQRNVLYEEENGDAIIHALMPKYHAHLDCTRLDPQGSLFNIIYYGALECMVGAFLWPKETCDSYSHPVSSLIYVTHELYLVLWGIAEDKRLKEVDEEFAELRRTHASPDAYKENDADLSPAEKARAFRNALSSKNKVGWIFFDGTHRTEQIDINRAGLKLVQRLFEHNDDATPADLLKIMDQCIDAHINRPAPGDTFKHGVTWNTRTGATNVFLFAKNLKAIVNELHIKDCPIKTFLGDITKEQTQEEPMALAA